MTDEQDPQPNVLSGGEPPSEGGEDASQGGENAEDLDATQLEAAAEGAEDEVSDEEEEDAEADTVVLEPGGIEAAPGAPGAPRLEPEVRGPRPRGPRAATRTAFAIDPALRIHDRASAIFVILSVAVFTAIIANGLLFGHGGAFTPIPTPSPIPQASELPSESPSEAPSPSPAPSLAPTGSPAGSAGSAAVPSVAPTTAPSPAST